MLISRPQVLSLALAGALGASSVAQAQEPADPVPAPAEVVAAPAVAAGSARVRPDPLEALSEQTVGGLTADEAARRAVEAAPSLDSVRAGVAVARAGARRAWQGFFPQLEVLGRYTRLSPITQPAFGDFSLDTGGVDIDQVINGVSDPVARELWRGLTDALGSADFNFPVILDQVVFSARATVPVSDIIFTILPGYRAAETAVDAQRAQLDAEARTVALRAREAFYNYARARGALRIAQSSVLQVESSRNQVAALVDAGVTPRVDLLRVDAQLAQARVGVAQAEGGVAIAHRALQILLGVGLDTELGLGQSFADLPQEEAGTLAALTEQAIHDRPDVAAVDQLIRARRASIEAELGRRYPQLVLQGGVDIANPNQRIIPQQQEFNTTWDVSVVLRWSPNEFGAARQRVAEVRAQVEQVEADRQRLLNGVRVEVAQAYETRRSARAAVEAARTGVLAAEESYRVRQDQLAAGAAVTADVIDAEAELSRARLQLLTAAIDLFFAHDRLRLALGADPAAALADE